VAGVALCALEMVRELFYERDRLTRLDVPGSGMVHKTKVKTLELDI
jgi:hypothetical protein